MAQQTAVEWLAKELESYGDPQVCDITWKDLDSLVEQAKQMEKEQLVKAWDDGDYAYFYSKETGRDFDNGEEYYNETFISTPHNGNPSAT